MTNTMNITETTRRASRLVAHLRSHGFEMTHIYSEGERFEPSELTTLVAKGWDCTLRFAGHGSSKQWVTFVPDLGADAIADNGDDRGPFSAAIEAFFRLEDVR